MIQISKRRLAELLENEMKLRILKVNKIDNWPYYMNNINFYMADTCKALNMDTSKEITLQEIAYKMIDKLEEKEEISIG